MLNERTLRERQLMHAVSKSMHVNDRLDKESIIEGRESILLQYTAVYHPFTEVSDLCNVIHVLRFHHLGTAGLVARPRRCTTATLAAVYCLSCSM